MKRKKVAFFILIIILQLINVVPCQGLTEDGSNRVVLIIVNRAGYEDFSSMEQLNKIMEKGYLGVMNTRASGGNSEYKSYATIGWGTRAEANAETSVFNNLDEENIAIYRRRNGNLSEEEGVVTLSLNRLIDQNLKGEYGAVPGALGEALTESGLKAAVYGNSDAEDRYNAPAAFITMNQAGFTALGDVSNRLLLEDEESPFSMKTNYPLLLEGLKESYHKSSLLVMETGDFSRLEAYRKNLSTEMYQWHRERILKDIDQFIGEVVDNIDENTLLIILSPYPSGLAIEAGNRLTPVVFYKKNQSQGGLLTSGTTRRPGIIGNVDIAPTILHYLGAESNLMAGRVLNTTQEEDQLKLITDLNSRVLNTSQQRYRVLYSFAVYEMLATVLALILIIFRKKLNHRYRKWVSRLVLATMIGPFSLLILPLFGKVSLTMTYLLLLLVTLLFTLLIDRLAREPLQAITLATGILVFALTLDLLLGQPLIKNSILGYDPIIGARYYGIGNEFSGVLLGSSLVLCGALIERYPKAKWLMVPLFGLLVFVIGFPGFGANVGATITAIFVYLFTFFRLQGVKLNAKVFVIIALSVIGGIALLAVIDIVFLSNESHLAGAVKQLYYNGPQVVPQIITRKIAMNIRVMGVTIWSRVLLLALAVVGILFYKPMGILKKFSATYPSMAIGWSSIVVACIVGFSVNDSGVVLAATAAIFLSASMLYIVLNNTQLLE